MQKLEDLNAPVQACLLAILETDRLDITWVTLGMHKFGAMA